MASVNKVIIIGRLGRDPEVRYTQGGQAVGNFTVATNEVWNDRNGQRQERTEWHRIVAWGKLAEQCRDYLAKGRSVYVEGRLQTRDWEDREGHKRQSTEVVAQTIQFLDRREGGPGGSGGASADGSAGADGPAMADPPASDRPDDDDGLTDDDIPF